MDDYIGRRFGRLVTVSEADPVIDNQGHKVRRVTCLCDCGNTKTIRLSNLRRGQTKSCGCLARERFIYLAQHRPLKDLVGRKFGKLTVISELETRLDKSGRRRRVWLCRCECGKLKPVAQSNLRAGCGTQSCGCRKGKKTVEYPGPGNLIGNRYGRLTVLRKAELSDSRADSRKHYWECACDCGNKTVAAQDNLRSGHTYSCGCLKKELRSGHRFGQLMLLSLSHKESGMAFWNCRCDCGRELTVSKEMLFRANRICCECYTGPQSKADLCGKQFGRLRVLMQVDPLHEASGRLCPSWLCRCVCGREVVVRERNLLKKVTRSCGCLKRKANRQLW